MTEMTNSPLVSVVVPLFNEEPNMPILQSELRAALGGLDHEIIFVDDGSIDRTVERIEQPSTKAATIWVLLAASSLFIFQF